MACHLPELGPQITHLCPLDKSIHNLHAQTQDDIVPPPSSGFIKALIARIMLQTAPVPIILPGQYFVLAALMNTKYFVSARLRQLEHSGRMTHILKSPN